MLTNMQKAMSDLEIRINKLERSQLVSPALRTPNSSLPPPITPILPKPGPSSYDNKRTRISSSSSDENNESSPHPVNQELQNTINEQNVIITEQKTQMNIMMAQLQFFSEKFSQ